MLCRVVAPAGLDLGAVENAEIGVAVLAELVARRAAGEFAAPARVEEVAAADAVDPVCHMTVDRRTARYRSNIDGRDVFFKFNYKDVIEGKRLEQNIELRPGDTIVVP